MGVGGQRVDARGQKVDHSKQFNLFNASGCFFDRFRKSLVARVLETLCYSSGQTLNSSHSHPNFFAKRPLPEDL